MKNTKKDLKKGINDAGMRIGFKALTKLQALIDKEVEPLGSRSEGFKDSKAIEKVVDVMVKDAKRQKRKTVLPRDIDALEDIYALTHLGQ